MIAGRLKDAVEVCIRNLKDLQLAIIIIRLFESDPEQASFIITTILSVENLGYSISSADSVKLFGTGPRNNVYDYLDQTVEKRNVCNDPFIRSITYWFLKDYKQALNTLYEIDIVNILGNANWESNDVQTSISHVFNFYTFLKNHPFVLRQYLVEENKNTTSASHSLRGNFKTIFFYYLFKFKFDLFVDIFKGNLSFNQNYNFSNNKNVADDKNLKTKTDVVYISPIERRLHFTVAYCHLINGCPLLTLDVLSKLPNYIIDGTTESSLFLFSKY